MTNSQCSHYIRPEDFGSPVTSNEIQQAYDSAAEDSGVCFTQGEVYPIDECIKVSNPRVTTVAHGAIFHPVGESLTGKNPMFDLNPEFDGTTTGQSISREVKWFGGTFGKAADLPDNRRPVANAFSISGLRAGGIFGTYFISVRNPIKGAIADSFRVRDCYLRNHLVGVYCLDELAATPQDLWINNNTFASSRHIVIPEIPYVSNGLDDTYSNIDNGLCDDDIVDFNDKRYYVINADESTFQVSTQQGGGPAAVPAGSSSFRLIPAGVMLDGTYSNIRITENNFAAKFGSALYATTGGKRGNAKAFNFHGNATEQMTKQKVIWVDDVQGDLSLARVSILDNDLASGSAETIYIDSLGNSADASSILGNEFTSTAGTHITVNYLDELSKLKIDGNTMSATTGQILQVNGGTGKVIYGASNAEPVGAGTKIAPNLYIDPEL